MPQLKRPLLVLHVCGDNLNGEVKLSETILGLTTRNLIQVAQKLGVFRAAVPIFRHTSSHHFDCSAIFRSASATISRVIRSFSMLVLP